MNSFSIILPVCNDMIRNRCCHWRGEYEKKTCDPNELIKQLILEGGKGGRIPGAFRSSH